MNQVHPEYPEQPEEENKLEQNKAEGYRKDSGLLSLGTWFTLSHLRTEIGK